LSSFRVMTFNVRGANREDGINIWPQRAQLNIEMIEHYAPDLIGFQECQHGNLTIYQEQLKQYQHVSGPLAGNEEPYDYNTISWKPSRLRQINSGSFWLSQTPEVAAFGWDAACIRAAHWMRFKLVGNEKELLHVNTHLDHVGEQARQEGARLILQWLTQLRDTNLPIIVTGDFNCEPGSPAYRLFLEHDFVDVYIATGNIDDELAGTFHDFGKIDTSFKEAQWRIDWILLHDPLGQLQPRTCEILRYAQPPLYPSDHYPVLATFEVQ
jgi:endonuclease/exonuclease/phosphatase family metal-dependent hydrolase